MSIIDDITRDSLRKKIPRFKAGDTVRVYLKIKEGEKERVQYYEGVVIAIHRNGISTTFKVRKESYGVGVERTFPLFSPLIQKIEVKRRGDVRRAKLYYLRKLSGKKAKVKERKDWMLKKSEVELKEADREMELELPPEEEVAVGAAAEVADTAPVEGEADVEMTEEAVEADAAEDAAAGDPVIGEEADLEAEAQPEEQVPPAEPAPRKAKKPDAKAKKKDVKDAPSMDEATEVKPAAEAAEEKGVEDSPPKAAAKKEKDPRKPRKKKSEQNG